MDLDYIEKAVLFYEHIENHKEVKESLIHKGKPICKICNKSADQIYNETKNNEIIIETTSETLILKVDVENGEQECLMIPMKKELLEEIKEFIKNPKNRKI